MKEKSKEELVKEIDAPKIIDEFIALAKRTGTKDARRADVEKFHALLRERPDLKLWRLITGISGAAEASLLEHDALTPILRASWRLRMAQMRLDLGYDESPEMEQLLITHAVLCWLRLNMVETFAAQIMNKSVSLKLADFYERQLARAQRRFTHALESLARVRAMTAATRLIESRIERSGGDGRANMRLLKSAAS